MLHRLLPHILSAYSRRRRNRGDGGGTPVTPTNNVRPSIPALETGVEATATPGSWSNATSVTGEWLVDNVVVATGYTYTPVAADADKPAYFRETAVNGAETATANSDVTTVLYNPVVIPNVIRWATVRRELGLSTDDSVDPIPEVLGGFSFFAPSGVQAPVYVAAAGGNPPYIQFDGIDDISEHPSKAAYNFLHQGPSTMFFVVDGNFDSSQYLWTAGIISANASGTAILVTANDIRYYLTNGSGTHIYLLDYDIVLTPGRHSLGFAQDLTDLRFYLDGVLTVTLPIVGTPAYNAGDSFGLPRFSNTSLEWSDRVADGVMANRKLNATEILQLHNNLAA